MDDVNFFEEVDFAKSGENPPTWKEVAATYGLPSGEAARSKYRRGRKKTKKDEPGTAKLDEDDANFTTEYNDEAVSVFFEDKKKPEDINWRELIDLAEKNQSFRERADDTQRIAEINIKTDKPIAIMNTGDWHLGDGSIDYDSWMNDMEFVLNAERLFMIEVGDMYQNLATFKVLSAIFAQVLTPAQQALLIRSIIDELSEKNKLLARVDGNHDVDFDERIFGQAVMSYNLRHIKAPRFRNRGLVKLTVGDQLYTLLLFHKSRFRSFLRATHGNMREYQLSYPADIVVGAHDHQPAYEVVQHYTLARQAGMGFGGETMYIKVGTYQDGEYGWKFFHNGGILNPTVVLYPDKHKKLIFSEPRDAVRYIETY